MKGEVMYNYKIYYDGSFLREGNTYETIEEAAEEANADKENFINDWQMEGCEYEEELFDIKIIGNK